MLAQLSLNYMKGASNFADSFSLSPNEDENKEIYLIVRSLKHKDGTQKVLIILETTLKCLFRGIISNLAI